MNRTQKLAKIIQGEELWQKLYYKHQRHYIRQQLLEIKISHLNQKPQIMRVIDIDRLTSVE